MERNIDDSDFSKSPRNFQRPLNNKANLGYGLLKCASLELLVEGGKYVKDDTLFIKFTITNEKLTSGRVKLDVYGIHDFNNIACEILFNL